MAKKIVKETVENGEKLVNNNYIHILVDTDIGDILKYDEEGKILVFTSKSLPEIKGEDLQKISLQNRTRYFAVRDEMMIYEPVKITTTLGNKENIPTVEQLTGNPYRSLTNSSYTKLAVRKLANKEIRNDNDLHFVAVAPYEVAERESAGYWKCKHNKEASFPYADKDADGYAIVKTGDKVEFQWMAIPKNRYEEHLRHNEFKSQRKMESNEEVLKERLKSINKDVKIIDDSSETKVEINRFDGVVEDNSSADNMF